MKRQRLVTDNGTRSASAIQPRILCEPTKRLQHQGNSGSFDNSVAAEKMLELVVYTDSPAKAESLEERLTSAPDGGNLWRQNNFGVCVTA